MNSKPKQPDGVYLLRGERAIEGVQVIPKRRIPDERGTILHFLKSTDPEFRQFGEIYFSTIYPGIVKGWHRHRDMALNYVCPVGRIKLVVYDDRPDSPSRGSLMEIFLGADNHALAIVPPEVWNGFKGISEPFALVANCATHTHEPGRSDRLDPFRNEIPYDWNVRQH